MGLYKSSFYGVQKVLITLPVSRTHISGLFCKNKDLNLLGKYIGSIGYPGDLQDVILYAAQEIISSMKNELKK